MVSTNPPWSQPEEEDDNNNKQVLDALKKTTLPEASWEVLIALFSLLWCVVFRVGIIIMCFVVGIWERLKSSLWGLKGVLTLAHFEAPPSYIRFNSILRCKKDETSDLSCVCVNDLNLMTAPSSFHSCHPLVKNKIETSVSSQSFVFLCKIF